MFKIYHCGKVCIGLNVQHIQKHIIYASCQDICPGTVLCTAVFLYRFIHYHRKHDRFILLQVGITFRCHHSQLLRGMLLILSVNGVNEKIRRNRNRDQSHPHNDHQNNKLYFFLNAPDLFPFLPEFDIFCSFHCSPSANSKKEAVYQKTPAPFFPLFFYYSQISYHVFIQFSTLEESAFYRTCCHTFY